MVKKYDAFDELVVRDGTTYVAVAGITWEKINEVQNGDGPEVVWQFNGRLPGMKSVDGETAYIRCVVLRGTSKWEVAEGLVVAADDRFSPVMGEYL